MRCIHYKDLKLSALGFGNMRLPVLPGGAIDTAEADKMIEHAYEKGVNYFDTAYGYHAGESEYFIGKTGYSVPAGALQRLPF